MPEAEYRDWQEFYEREPWGLHVLDVMHAHVISMLANINRNHEVQPEEFAIEDFLLFPEQAPDVPTIEDLHEAFQFNPRKKVIPADA